MNQIFAALRNKGIQFDAVYKGMISNDLADAVFAAKEVLDKIEYFKEIPREGSLKSEWMSTKLREEGNVAYCAGKYQLALECYNKALALAPENSRAMKLAYSNRSALSMKNFSYIASDKDIDKCLAMGCPEDIEEKLLRRKAQVCNLKWVEEMALASEQPKYMDFFKINGKINPDIPCASEDVTVIEEFGNKKIVTTKEIKVGTVLAHETAFAARLAKANENFACYYCTKLSLNLIPCSNCHVFFCSEDCMKMSMEDGHSVECQFMDIIYKYNIPIVHFAFKSALKMRKMCKSWDEYIDASINIGDDRIKNSTVKQVYDANEKFSLLCAKNDRVFVHGQIFHCSFACAIIMHYLRDVASFLPEGQKKKRSAIRALMRITIHLYLHVKPTVLSLCAGSRIQQCTHLHVPNYGSFSFMGKLEHSCHPNCLAVCLNNRLALVALEPIKPGTELTISLFGQFRFHRNFTIDKKAVSKMFDVYGLVCDCRACSDDKLTNEQKKILDKLNWDDFTITAVDNIYDVYPQVCTALAGLYNVQHTTEYVKVYDAFEKCLLRAIISVESNIVFDFNHFPQLRQETD